MEMTQEEERGRRITLAIATLAGGWPVVVFVIAILTGATIVPSAWMSRLAVPLGLAWLLVRGRRWVRGATVIGFALGALAAMFRLGEAATLAAILGESIFATVHAIAAATLAMSPAVGAYFQARNRLTSLGLTSE
jgi:hypothetical protein